MEIKSIAQLIRIKLEKLTWEEWTGKSITSQEGFELWVDYIENIGVNKDKNQLLLNVKYKGQPVFTTATTDKDAMEYFGVWYMQLGKEIQQKIKDKEEEIQEEGKTKFNNI
jgi:hypothetical protein